MRTLTINDLALTNELSRKDMATVRGGYKMGGQMDSLSCYPQFPLPSATKSIDATQNLAQVQNVFNATANGSAFIDGVHVTNNTSQFGQNNLLVA
jgi:hypothetical protein